MTNLEFMKIKSYKDLIVWKKSRVLVKTIYSLTSEFPKIEQYNIVDQMRRAVVSIPSNIAEGQRRNYQAEYRRFVGISLGSNAELETLLLLSYDIGYINKDKLADILSMIDEISRMLYSLMKSLATNINKNSTDPVTC